MTGIRDENETKTPTLRGRNVAERQFIGRREAVPQVRGACVIHLVGNQPRTRAVAVLHVRRRSVISYKARGGRQFVPHRKGWATLRPTKPQNTKVDFMIVAEN